MLINYVILLSLGLIWGSSFLFLKLALASFEPFTLGAIRLVVGGAMIICLALATRQPLPRRKRDWAWIGVVGIVASAIAFAFMNTGQALIESSEGGIIITTVPLFTLVLAHWFTDDKMSWRKVLGVAVGFAGVMVMFGPTLLSGFAASIVGQSFIIVTSFCYACGTVITRRQLGGVAPLMAAGFSLALASLILIPAAFIFEQPLAMDPTPSALVGVIGASVLSTGVAIALLFVIIARAGPNFASMNNYLSPVVSLTWGYIFLAEPVTGIKIGALMLLMLGIAIGTSKRGIAAHSAPVRVRR